MKGPGEPTAAQIEAHNAHLPRRSWCRHCVRGCGKVDPHEKAAEEREHGAPTIAIDYAFLGKKLGQEEG
eukprot:10343425-Heterocapsa_arctica.AAC.1